MSPRKRITLDLDYTEKSLRLAELRLERAEDTLLREVMKQGFAGDSVDDERLRKVDRLRGSVMAHRKAASLWRRAYSNAKRWSRKEPEPRWGRVENVPCGLTGSAAAD